MDNSPLLSCFLLNENSMRVIVLIHVLFTVQAGRVEDKSGLYFWPRLLDRLDNAVQELNRYPVDK